MDYQAYRKQMKETISPIEQRYQPQNNQTPTQLFKKKGFANQFGKQDVVSERESLGDELQENLQSQYNDQQKHLTDNISHCVLNEIKNDLLCLSEIDSQQTRKEYLSQQKNHFLNQEQCFPDDSTLKLTQDRTKQQVNSHHYQANNTGRSKNTDTFNSHQSSPKTINQSRSPLTQQKSEEQNMFLYQDKHHQSSNKQESFQQQQIQTKTKQVIDPSPIFSKQQQQKAKNTFYEKFKFLIEGQNTQSNQSNSNNAAGLPHFQGDFQIKQQQQSSYIETFSSDSPQNERYSKPLENKNQQNQYENKEPIIASIKNQKTKIQNGRNVIDQKIENQKKTNKSIQNQNIIQHKRVNSKSTHNDRSNNNRDENNKVAKVLNFNQVNEYPHEQNKDQNLDENILQMNNKKQIDQFKIQVINYDPRTLNSDKLAPRYNNNNQVHDELLYDDQSYQQSDFQQQQSPPHFHMINQTLTAEQSKSQSQQYYYEHQCPQQQYLSQQQQQEQQIYDQELSEYHNQEQQQLMQSPVNQRKGENYQDNNYYKQENSSPNMTSPSELEVQLQSDKKVLENNIDKYEQAIQQYQAELQLVRQELEQLRSQQSCTQDMDNLNSQLMNLQQIFIEKKKQLEEEIEQSNAQHKNLKTKLKAANNELSHLRSKTSALEAENIQLKKQFQCYLEQNSALQMNREDKIQEYQAQIESLREKYNIVEKQRQEESSIYLLQIHSLQQSINEYHANQVQYQETISQLKQQLNAFQLYQLQNQYLTIQSNYEQQEQVQQQQLQQQQEQMEAIKRASVKQEEQIQLSKDIELFERQIEIIKSEYEQRRSDFEINEKEIIEERDNLIQKNQENETRISNITYENNKITQLYEDMKGQYEQLKLMNIQLQNQITDIQSHQQSISVVNNLLASAQEEVRQLKLNEEQIQKHYNEIQMLKSEEIEKLKERIEEYECHKESILLKQQIDKSSKQLEGKSTLENDQYSTHDNESSSNQQNQSNSFKINEHQYIHSDENNQYLVTAPQRSQNKDNSQMDSLDFQNQYCFRVEKDLNCEECSKVLSKLQSLKQKKRQYKENLSQSNLKCIELEKENIELNTKIESLEQNQKEIIDQSHLEIAQLQSAQQQSHLENQSLRKELDIINQTIIDKNIALEQSQKEIQSLKEQSESTKNNILKSNVNSVEEQIKDLTENKELSQEEIAQKDELINEYVDTILQFKSQIEYSNNFIQQQALQIVKLYSKKEMRNNENSDQQYQFNQLHTDNNSSDSEAKQAQQNIQDISNLIYQQQCFQTTEVAPDLKEKQSSTEKREQIIEEKHLQDFLDEETQLEKGEEQNQNQDCEQDEEIILRDQFQIFEEKLLQELSNKCEEVEQLQEELSVWKAYSIINHNSQIQSNNFPSLNISKYQILENKKQQLGIIQEEIELLNQQISEEDEQLPQERVHQEQSYSQEEQQESQSDSNKSLLKENEELKEQLGNQNDDCKFKKEGINQLVKDCTGISQEIENKEQEINHHIKDNQNQYQMLKRKNQEYLDLSKEYDTDKLQIAQEILESHKISSNQVEEQSC